MVPFPKVRKQTEKHRAWTRDLLGEPTLGCSYSLDRPRNTSCREGGHTNPMANSKFFLVLLPDSKTSMLKAKWNNPSLGIAHTQLQLVSVPGLHSHPMALHGRHGGQRFQLQRYGGLQGSCWFSFLFFMLNHPFAPICNGSVLLVETAAF